MTPDTEEIVKRVAENVWRSGNSYRSDAERKAEIEEIIRSLLSSRDTYWKERVRKEVEYSRDFICSRGSYPQEYSSHLNTVSVSLVEKAFKNLDTLLDNLK